LDVLLAKLAPTVRKSLRPPSKKRAITELEKTIKRSLPEEVKASLACHDGQTEVSGGCVFGYRLLPVESIVAYWELSRGHDGDAVPIKRIRSIPNGAVQHCESHPGWIPLVSDWNANYICVDLAPNLDGQRGQVIVFGRDSYHYVLAATWGEFLANYADDLRDGYFEVTLEDGSDVPEFCYHLGGGDTIQAIVNSLRVRKKT
jgi:cell wall assembly regulator SMI1